MRPNPTFTDDDDNPIVNDEPVDIDNSEDDILFGGKNPAGWGDAVGDEEKDSD